MLNKKTESDIREWLLTSENLRVPKKALMRRAGIKDIRTLNNHIRDIEQTLNQNEEYDPGEQFFKNYKRIDAALMRACDGGNAAALKVFYQLSGRLVEKTENLNLDLTADDITRRNLEAERRLRESGYRVEDVQEERPLLPEDIREPSGQGVKGDN